ncbi:MAG: hypothetical protein KDN05_22745, partial [Verrucomicrobiae bacterium]|nr:hypothetical protein [Verrucomicrobiae bacterium]
NPGEARFWNPDTAGWENPGLYGYAVDMDAGGTAIGAPPATLPVSTIPFAPILLNGDWTGIPRWAPDVPAEWGTTTKLLDTTPGGWVLATRETVGEPDVHAVALPIRAEGSYVTEAFPAGGPRHHACGVDDFSIGSYKPGPAVQDRIWIMAPQFSGAATVTFRSPVDPDHPVSLSASGIDLGGGQLIGGLMGGGSSGGQTTDLPVSATSPLASGTEVVADLTLGGQTSLSRPLGFKVMKSRVVKVGLCKVAKTGDSPGAPTLPIEPVSLTKHLNDVFKPQINVIFQVIPMDDIAVDWDVAGGNPGTLDTGNKEVSSETQKILDKAAEQSTDVNIHVFIVGGGKLLAIPGESGNSAGSTVRDDLSDGDVPNACWVAGDPVNGRTQAQLYQTVAHEIGHVLVGYGHPDDGTCDVLLPKTDDSRRLMSSGRGYGGIVRDILLVKGEWDKAEDRLSYMIDEQEPE